jgi:hypothetical protein
MIKKLGQNLPFFSPKSKKGSGPGAQSALIFPSEKNQLPFSPRSSSLREETVPARPS